MNKLLKKKCIICENEFDYNGSLKKGRERMTCSSKCSRTYFRVYQYAFMNIKQRVLRCQNQ